MQPLSPGDVESSLMVDFKQPISQFSSRGSQPFLPSNGFSSSNSLAGMGLMQTLGVRGPGGQMPGIGMVSMGGSIGGSAGPMGGSAGPLHGMLPLGMAGIGSTNSVAGGLAGDGTGSSEVEQMGGKHSSEGQLNPFSNFASNGGNFATGTGQWPKANW